MERKKGKFGLAIVALFFAIAGFIIMYVSFVEVVKAPLCSVGEAVYVRGDSVPDYKKGYDCICQGDGIVCTRVEENLMPTTIDQFERENLSLAIKYVSDVSFAEGSPIESTKFTNIAVTENKIEISLEQEQLCSNDRRIPPQIGMYRATYSTLLVTNIVNRATTTYIYPCIVSLTFTLKNHAFDDLEFLKIGYMSESGEVLPATLCYYNGNLYGDEDSYIADDECNVCRCENGTSKCSNDRVCD